MLYCFVYYFAILINIKNKVFDTVKNKDIRWIQRYDSFHKAVNRILEVTKSDRTPGQLSDLEKEGLVQRFEYTFELAWKVLQDLLVERGYAITPGPNPTLQKAFEDGIIVDHDGWRRMMKARNTTSHTYNEGEALTVVECIYQDYSHLLEVLDKTLAQEVVNAQMNNLFD